MSIVAISTVLLLSAMVRQYRRNMGGTQPGQQGLAAQPSLALSGLSLPETLSVPWQIQQGGFSTGGDSPFEAGMAAPMHAGKQQQQQQQSNGGSATVGKTFAGVVLDPPGVYTPRKGSNLQLSTSKPSLEVSASCEVLALGKDGAGRSPSPSPRGYSAAHTGSASGVRNGGLETAAAAAVAAVATTAASTPTSQRLGIGRMPLPSNASLQP